MRVLMLSKACVVGIYQPKLEAIARRGIDLKVLAPPSWKDERGEQILERAHTAGYQLQSIPIRFNGSFHLHHYPTLGREMSAFQPQIVHIDEEPYNLATWQALYQARRIGAKALFFTWQNIKRTYPPPFSWGESWVYRKADYALAGTDDAADVLRAKGYTGPVSTIPQFGADEALFQPAPSRPDRPFTIGYIGRIVPAKGVDLLLRALAALDSDWRLRLVGGGPALGEMRTLAGALGIADRVTVVGQLPSTEVPAQYREIDVLVLPSLTGDNWKEQFGRVLVEAMASGVAVIGSDSGAIPGVIGAAGLIVPEGDVPALTRAIRDVKERAAVRADLAERGRERFLSTFTNDSIARETVAVYRGLMERGPSSARAG
ncbi:MAG: glycosyltransferase family 4 protein [Chloroflexota bacterium]|nr:glycosyltransferase family 4 protein [Chloroflexota bacterium]